MQGLRPGYGRCDVHFRGDWGWPRHLHYDQDEWIYVIDGEIALEVGNRAFRAGAGESVFIPRKVPHVWSAVGHPPGKIINVYQPAGRMEEFFREILKVKDLPTREQVIKQDLHRATEARPAPPVRRLRDGSPRPTAHCE